MSCPAESGMNARLVIHFPLPAARYSGVAPIPRADARPRHVPAHAGQTEWRKSFNAVTAIVGCSLGSTTWDGRNFVALAILVSPISSRCFFDVGDSH